MTCFPKLKGNDLAKLISFDNFDIPPSSVVYDENHPELNLTVKDLDNIENLDPFQDEIGSISNKDEQQQPMKETVQEVQKQKTVKPPTKTYNLRKRNK